MNDYVIVQRYDRRKKPARQRWHIQRNHAPVLLPNASAPLAFATRDEAAAWIAEQKEKEGVR